MAETSPVGRPIRSFVLRQGRMSVAQQRAHDSAARGVRHPLCRAAAGPRRPCSVAHAPKILEIGFGMGDATAAIAAAHPENDYLGIEVHSPGVGSLLNANPRSAPSTNLRIIQHDAVEVLRDMIPDGSLAGVHIFFPDPWHKKRHNKRRLIKPDFVALTCPQARPRRLPALRHRLGRLRHPDTGGAVRRARAHQHALTVMRRVRIIAR